MQCPQCQAENPERARFCEDCGARLEFKCPHCGETATPGKKFCASCGGSLLTAPAVSRPAPSPDEYTPQHLAERILTSRAALEGERKQVTVLFADLKGSMELLADRDPEEARAILDPVLERMMDAVHRYEGTVNQVMGDGIMALFGAPLAHEDHAVRGCYAALRMQEAVHQYADTVFRTLGVRVQIRVGLNSGEVVVRSIGSDLRMDYTAVGQTTHLAARMEQTTLPGSVLLAPDTLRLVEGYVQVKALGAVPIKGLDAPVEVYELLGAGTARSRLQAAAARGLTKFVGRDTELETLRRTLEQAGSGHGQVVALVGEPGVGKSRLAWEFSHSHRTQDWLVLESQSVSYGKATAYLPVIDLLKTYCGVEDRDDARRVREKVTGKLLALDPALQPTLSALLALLDVPLDDATWQTLDPPQRRQRTLDACKRLILRESQEQPLLVVFEDLHWIDAETQALLDSLVESLPTARLLLLVNYRPEYEHTWHRRTYYQQLRLDPLPPASAEDLLTALLGDDPSLGPLKRLLVERTEGNPFFLEESVQSLVETGGLVGERGAYRLAQPLRIAQVPATVQTVLAARIDRLTPEDKRLLQAAAVIGKDVPYALLRAIVARPEEALQQGLACLQATEFLYETSLFPELEYTFKHALTHEVAYGSLLQDRRRTLHTRIVEAIEMLYPDRLAEQVERLAYHAVRGEQWPAAVRYLHQAGRKALAHSAHWEAVGYLEQALAALVRLPETRETREQALDLRLDLRNALFSLGEIERLLQCQREAQTLAEALDDPRRLGHVLADLAVQYRLIGEHDRSIESGERALSLAQAMGDTDLAATVNVRLGQTYEFAGDYRRAIEFFHKMLAVRSDDPLRVGFGIAYPSVGARGLMGGCLAELGEFGEGARWVDEALRLADLLDHPASLVVACHCMGELYLRQGNIEQALPVLERGLLVGQSAQVALYLPWITSAIGYAYAQIGRLNEAVVVLEQVVGHGRSVGPLSLQSLDHARLSAAYLLAGRREDARVHATEALALARQCRGRSREAEALRVLGEIAAHADPPEVKQAESYYRQALALADELGMRPLAAHCHLGLGTLYQKIGRDEDAHVELTTAAELYRAMEMPFWLARAEAEVGQIASAP